MTHEEAFEKAMAHVAEWEGVYSNDKYDAGGETKYGVCMEFLRDLGTRGGGDINHDGVVDRRDVIAVTKQDAKKIFKKEFWDKPKLERFHPIVAMMMFDSNVNCGCRQTNKLLQRAVKTADDGIIGPKTIAAAEAMPVSQIIARFSEQRRRFYNGLASNKPTQKKFLKGWLNRTNACERLAVKCL